MKRLGLICLVLLIILPTILAIDEVDKVYFQTQQEKLVAQVNAKIDTQTNKISQDMKTSVEQARTQIKDEMTTLIKGSLRAVAVGLAGLIIITLAIFKVIDLKISTTRNIKKYEDIVQTKAKELDDLINKATMERNELVSARTQLVEFQKRLQTWDNALKEREQHINQAGMQFGMQPMYQQPPVPNPNYPQNTYQMPSNLPPPPNLPPNYQQPPQYQQQGYYPPQGIITPPPQQPPKKKEGFKKFLIFLLVVAIIVMIGVAVYQYLL